jgi:hypothetical protein
LRSANSSGLKSLIPLGLLQELPRVAATAKLQEEMFSAWSGSNIEGYVHSLIEK